MTTDVSIDRDVPMPESRVKYPYASLEIGDSFLVPNRSMQIVCNNNHRLGKRLNRKFSAKTVEGGIRVWRTS